MMSSEEGQGLDAFNLRDLANAAWGLAVLQHASAHPACMQAIARQAAHTRFSSTRVPILTFFWYKKYKY